MLDDTGTPDFNALQNTFDASRTDSIVYFVFDVPFFEGYDLRQVPLHARRGLLKQLLDERGTDRVRFSADFEASAASVLQSACQLNLEGVIAKRRDAPYVSTRSDTWLKLKCAQRQEFVIGGFTDRSNAADEVGSLLLGVHDEQGPAGARGQRGYRLEPRDRSPPVHAAACAGGDRVAVRSVVAGEGGPLVAAHARRGALGEAAALGHHRRPRGRAALASFDPACRQWKSSSR